MTLGDSKPVEATDCLCNKGNTKIHPFLSNIIGNDFIVAVTQIFENLPILKSCQNQLSTSEGELQMIVAGAVGNFGRYCAQSRRPGRLAIVRNWLFVVISSVFLATVPDSSNDNRHLCSANNGLPLHTLSKEIPRIFFPLSEFEELRCSYEEDNEKAFMQMNKIRNRNYPTIIFGFWRLKFHNSDFSEALDELIQLQTPS